MNRPKCACWRFAWLACCECDGQRGDAARTHIVPLSLMMLSLLVMTSCRSQSPDNCLCTTQHVSVTFAVVDDAGTPVPDVTLESHVPRTGESLQVEQDRAREGTYIVATDSNLKQIRHSGETIEVKGTWGQRSFSEVFVVNAPGECVCHIAKVSGPETVMLGRGSLN